MLVRFFVAMKAFLPKVTNEPKSTTWARPLLSLIEFCVNVVGLLFRVRDVVGSNPAGADFSTLWNDLFFGMLYQIQGNRK